MKKLCLLLLLAPPRRGQNGNRSPPLPPTPAPHRLPQPHLPPPPTRPPEPKEDKVNNENKLPNEEGTGEKPLALQDPPHRPEKRLKGQGRDPETDEKRRGQNTDQSGSGPPAQAPEPPTPEPPEKEQGPLGEGQVEGHPPPAPNGHDPNPPSEGEEGQGPDPDPTESILRGVAYHLNKWEETYKQLVEDILEDLGNYWQMLGIPQ